MATPPALSPRDQAAWELARPSVVTLTLPDGTLTGVAVLIDARGKFMADSSSAPVPELRIKLDDGRTAYIRVIFVDITTNLALLESPGWKETGYQVAVLADSPLGQRPLIAVLDSGPVRGYLANDRMSGLLGGRRYAPMTEVRLESGPGQVGGALAFTMDGRLAGVLSATLAPAENAQSLMMGPAEMTVSYSLAPVVLRRVIDGFLSPSGKPQHPTIGAFFNNAASGALVQRVVEGSASAAGGLREGDVVIAIDEERVSDAIDLARSLFERRVGDPVRLRVLRGEKRESVDLVIRVAAAE